MLHLHLESNVDVEGEKPLSLAEQMKNAQNSKYKFKNILLEATWFKVWALNFEEQ